MKTRFLLFMAAGVFISLHAVSQSYSQGVSDVNEIVSESLIESDVDPNEAEAQLHELELLSQHPININVADKEDFQKIPFLTDFQIESLIQYRNSHGSLISLNELQLVQGFTWEFVQLISPFITLGENDFGSRSMGSKRRITQEFELFTGRNIQKSRGYSKFDSLADQYYYPGNPWIYSGHYRIEAGNNIEAGVTVEKDAGEEFFSGSNRNGFDYYSGYVLLQKKGFVKSLIIGDYRLAFGQGLTLWHGAAPGKSSMPLSVVKRQDAIKPYRSNDENSFFRGVAASAEYKKFNVTLFLSSKYRDANITDTIADNVYFSSFQESGYHRTHSETADEKSVKVTAIGANLIFRNNHLKIGTTLVNYWFDKEMSRGDDLQNIHDFQGARLTDYGTDYLLTFSKIEFFGETSFGNKHWATINGLIMPVNKYASISIIYRNFSPGYYSLHSAAFSESSKDANEKGLYAGLVLHPVPKVKVSCYADFYKFPWLRYRLSKPSSGSDYLVRVDFNPSKKTIMYFRIKYESKPYDNSNMPDSIVLPEVIEQETSGFRFHISYMPVNQVKMQNRIEVSLAQQSKGILVYQDVQYIMQRIPLTLNSRVAWFNTGNYQARIYAYEQDMIRGFSFSPMFNSGFRFYVMADYSLSRKIAFAVRYSQTFYSNTQLIGTGYDEISSSSKSDVKFMLTIHL